MDNHIKFKNDSREPFNAVWDGAVRVLEVGQTILAPENIAKKYAKDLAYQVLNSQRAEQELKDRDANRSIKQIPITSSQLEAEMKKYLITEVGDVFVQDTQVVEDAKEVAETVEENTEEEAETKESETVVEDPGQASDDEFENKD